MINILYNSWKLILISGFFLLLAWSCSRKVESFSASEYDFLSPIDTKSKPIQLQEKRSYSFRELGISVDNLFDGARMNSAELENDTIIHITILPENTPINPSPWYAFRVSATTLDTIYFKLDYKSFKHRYNPTISYDRIFWKDYESSNLTFGHDSSQVTFPIIIPKNTTLWIAAQEIVNSQDVKNWCESMAQKPAVEIKQFGKSELDRPLLMLDIGGGKKKPIIVILSRQHPPEVTGYFAMQHFIERLLLQDSLSKEFLKEYRVLVFPLLNPDGVDGGHWRHNAGGIDLNRDWAKYNQPETRQVADRIVREVMKNDSQVLIGLDFHSTWYDVYYTNKETEDLTLPTFKDEWLSYIQNHLDRYSLDERPSKIGQPVSKGWFYTQFKAVGITYEIGDNTPRNFIREKGKVSAEGLMKLLLKN